MTGTLKRLALGLGIGLLSLPLTNAPPAFAQEGEVFADPLMNLNRGVYGFNRGADKFILRPLSVGYGKVVPAPARRGLANLFDNLEAPVQALNHLLQLKPAPAARTMVRMAINSTVGVLGVFDVASQMQLPEEETDFGLTLARYGVGEGPYLVLPFLGPSTLRDAAASIGEMVFNPVPLEDEIVLKPVEDATLTAAEIAGGRLEIGPLLDDVYASEFGYERMRSFYLQNRRLEASGGELGDDSLPDIDLEGFDESEDVEGDG